MSKELDFAQQLIDFIYDSPTAFHAVERARKRLEEHGFKELMEGERWQLRKGGKHYVIKNNSALIAFVIGEGKVQEEGFRVIGAHTDSPGFRVKPSAEMTAESHYIKLDTEPYGAPILNTWLDRPLSVAGRVTLKSEDPFNPEVRLVNIRKPILTIPNLAFHLNKSVNSGVELNKQKDMLPLMSLINDKLERGNYLLNAAACELNVEPSDIADFELFLYEFEKGTIMGLNDEFISCSRLDDLAMVHGGITALIGSDAARSTNVIACFDNEEVGSSSKQGANSQLLSSILERIVLSTGGDREDFLRSMAVSFMISSDMTHAIHPNAGEKHDPQNRPLINKGPVIKISGNMRYTSDSSSSATYAQICTKAGVPVQRFVNNSNEVGGSTIGPDSAKHLHMRSVDIGSPILAMHSIRELGGVLDHTYVTRSFEEFYK